MRPDPKMSRLPLVSRRKELTNFPGLSDLL